MDKYEAWFSWKHDPICRLSEIEQIRYLRQLGDMELSIDGGGSWITLPWTMDLPSRLLLWLARTHWPPYIDCFGLYEGDIAIAWHNTSTEEEMYIGKYLARLDRDKQAWKFKNMGYFNLEDGESQTWFEHIGFSTLNRLRSVLR